MDLRNLIAFHEMLRVFNYTPTVIDSSTLDVVALCRIPVRVKIALDSFRLLTLDAPLHFLPFTPLLQPTNTMPPTRSRVYAERKSTSHVETREMVRPH